MPWRNLPPDLLAMIGQWIASKADELLLYLSLVATAMLGMLTKVASEVRDGDREKFLSSRLMLDFPSVLMMASVSYGIVTYLDLPAGVGASIGSLLGYLGPRVAYVLIAALADRIRGTGGK